MRRLGRATEEAIEKLKLMGGRGFFHIFLSQRVVVEKLRLPRIKQHGVVFSWGSAARARARTSTLLDALLREASLKSASVPSLHATLTKVICMSSNPARTETGARAPLRLCCRCRGRKREEEEEEEEEQGLEVLDEGRLVMMGTAAARVRAAAISLVGCELLCSVSVSLSSDCYAGV